MKWSCIFYICVYVSIYSCVIIVFLNWVCFDSDPHFESLDLDLVYVNLEIVAIHVCVCVFIGGDMYI